MACLVYAEGDLDTPIDLLKDKLIDTPTMYYMHVKRSCANESIEHKGKIYAEFNWENVLQLGSKKQQDAFNTFRNSYVKDLVLGYCDKHGCNPVPVGSAATSARSDIDFNMYSETKDVDYIIMNINRIHKKRFKVPIEELLDVNIYGTVVDVFDELLCGAGRCIALSLDESEKQHAWAFLRATEFIRDYTTGFVLKEGHLKLYKKCMALSKKMSGKKDSHSMYIRNIRIYLKSSKNEKNPAKLAEIYGKTKYYERETYRSVGATLDIVMKKSGLPKSLLIDSVYDNFGFAAEVLLTPPLCHNHPKDTRVYKTCKYVSRMCNALQKIKVDIDNLSELKELCDKMNNRRKKMLPLLSSDYKKLCKEIGAPTKFVPARFLQAIYDHLLVC